MSREDNNAAAGGLPGEGVSDADARLADAEMDSLIEAASRPRLADLYKKGKAAGLITPQQQYAHTQAA